MPLQSKINNSADNHSDKYDAKSDPKSDQVVATHISDGKEIKVTDTDTTKGNSPHKLLINRIIPEINPVVILTVNQTTVDRVAASGGTLHEVRTVLSNCIVTSAVYSAAHVFKEPLVVNWKYVGGTIPQDRNTVVMPPRSTTPVYICTGLSIYCLLMLVGEIEGPVQI